MVVAILAAISSTVSSSVGFAGLSLVMLYCATSGLMDPTSNSFQFAEYLRSLH